MHIRKNFTGYFLSLLVLALLLACEDTANTETGKLPTDEEIAATIQTQYGTSEAVPDDSIQVAVKNGIARLSGSVPSLLAKQNAIQIAEATPGVVSVINTLKITASRPDKDINEDIAEALESDPATESWEINSAVNNGFATLKGTVDTWQEKQLASEVVSGVRGVTGIENAILVSEDEARQDTAIKAEIASRLMYDRRIGDEMIEIEVADGIITLGGSVGSAAEKRLAVEVAHVAGVEKVLADHLEVHPELSSRLFRDEMTSSFTPQQIEKAIMTTFIYDPRVPDEQIKVAMEEGVAILTGTVKNLGAKRAATADALNTAGVESVKNNIEVKGEVVVTPEAPSSDDAIQSRILNAIHRDPYVEEAQITIRVNGGAVELSGEVDSQFEKEHIEDIVTNIKGIIAIDNQLDVER